MRARRWLPAVGLALGAAAPALAADDEVRFGGFAQSETAYTYSGDEHWSKFRNLLGVNAEGAFNESLSWKFSGWAYYDPVYDSSDYYPADVREDQRHEVLLRETYADLSAGDWDFRFGRQNIVWGEMVGLFFADVVSARDLREFVAQDFDRIRIPQWAARAEYFKDDMHAEFVWIPKMSYDEIGKPGDCFHCGADFYPYPPQIPGFGYRVGQESKPNGGSDDMAYGLRLSYLLNGWDVSGFYYRSMDAAPAFSRQIVLESSGPTLLYTPDHQRIQQWGMTFAKDLDGVVFRGEAIYTQGRRFDVLRLSDADGLEAKNYLDYVLSLDYSLENDARLNLQAFQRYYVQYDQAMIPDRLESGVSVYYSAKAWDNRLEPEITLIHSLNRNDWMLRPRLTWNISQDLKASFGVDVFHGPPEGLFGRYTDADRVYGELRYSF